MANLKRVELIAVGSLAGGALGGIVFVGSAYVVAGLKMDALDVITLFLSSITIAGAFVGTLVAVYSVQGNKADASQIPPSDGQIDAADAAHYEATE